LIVDSRLLVIISLIIWDYDIFIIELVDDQCWHVRILIQQSNLKPPKRLHKMSMT